MRENNTDADRKQVTAAISKKALIPLYLAIPAFYFLPVGIPTIIANVKYRIKKAATDALTNSMGLPSADSVTGQIVGGVTNAADEVTGGCHLSRKLLQKFNACLNDIDGCYMGNLVHSDDVQAFR